ncbi:MAG: hypothetical protein J6W81_03330 [Lentisphaeria bacterium]|nr:hypothetical protein [Lentisphaeria bacterium]
MEKYTVYILINSSNKEVFFGYAPDLNRLFAEPLPSELDHWDLRNDSITNPVMIEEDLILEEALSVIRTLQDNALRNPQGKTILLNQAALSHVVQVEE